MIDGSLVHKRATRALLIVGALTLVPLGSGGPEGGNAWARHGGQGRVTPTRVGPLRVGRATPARVRAVAGTPERRWRGSSPAGTSLEGDILGYGCHVDAYSQIVCMTYYGFTKGRLSAFRTRSRHFRTRRGTRVGASVRVAMRREGVYRQFRGQCPGFKIAAASNGRALMAGTYGSSKVRELYVGGPSPAFSFCGS